MRSGSPFPPQQATVQPKTWNKALEAKIMQAARRKPRFLFSSAILNDDMEHSAMLTRDGIVPQLFRHGFYGYSMSKAVNEPPPSTIFSIPLAEVRYHNTTNFLARGPHSERSAMWSLWFSSLREAAEEAVLRETMSTQYAPVAHEVYILVMDTHNLSDDNLVLHESDKYLLEDWNSVSEIRDSFLTFGVIPAEAFEMVPLSVLREHTSYTGALSSASLAPIDVLNKHDAPRDLAHAIHLAHMFGQAFGPKLALPVACIAITASAGTHTNDAGLLGKGSTHEAEIAAAFDYYEIPESILKDRSIVKEKPSIHVSRDTRRGLSLLRTIVKRKQGILESKARSMLQDQSTDAKATDRR